MRQKTTIKKNEQKYRFFSGHKENSSQYLVNITSQYLALSIYS